MIDYGLKSRVIAKGIDRQQRQVSKAMYLHGLEEQTGEVKEWKQMPYELAKEIEKNNIKNNPIEWQEAIKINNASYHRRNRLADRINLMLMFGDCIFLTLTFTDKVLNNTSEETRRKYVRRFLKKSGKMFVANVDYGKLNHREHYHAVIMSENVNPKNWTYGALNFERVKIGKATSTKLAKYVAKLTNHAIKETTHRNAVIYSRLEDLEL